MKTKLKLGILGLSLSLGAISLVTSTVLSSCQSQESSAVSKQPINQEVSQTFNDFLIQNHGRWAGNISKYGVDNLKSLKYTDSKGNEATAYIGVNDGVKPLYDLQTKIDPNVHNYGSHHSYLYIINKLISMGLVNHSGAAITYPAAATVTFDDTNKQFSVTLDSNTTQYAKKEDTTNPGTMIDDENIIISKNADNSVLNDGVVVQPFLWNGRDRANNVLNTYNNEGQNIIVTVTPNNNATNDFYIVAHYDSTASGKNKASWGATDNATGVSVALQIINYFKDNKEKLSKTRLHVIFSDAEEVGVNGTKAFVSQYLLNNGPLDPKNAIGMINMDTIAGGDYIYAHSPNTNPDLDYNGTGNTSTIIRDQLNALSRIRSENYNDPNLELIIHPQVDPTEYRAGETGDWSDHMPFYKYANIPVAYMESTNFQIRANSGKYDGYSQTTNLNAYILNDGTTLAQKSEQLKKTNINGSDLVVYDLPNYDGSMDAYNDYEVTGNIWHYDIDTLDWVQKYIGDSLYQQLTTMFESLKLFLQTSIK